MFLLLCFAMRYEWDLCLYSYVFLCICKYVSFLSSDWVYFLLQIKEIKVQLLTILKFKLFYLFGSWKRCEWFCKNQFLFCVNAQLRNKLHSECGTLCLQLYMLLLCYKSYVITYAIKPSFASYVLAYVIMILKCNHRKLNFTDVKMYMNCSSMCLWGLLYDSHRPPSCFLSPYYMLGSAW